MDNVPPISLLASSSSAALSINPSTGNVTARTLTGTTTNCVGSVAFGLPTSGDKAVLGGNTGLQINNSGRIQLVMTPIDYLNRTVFQGRRMISLRVAQPLLCVDFAPAPVGVVNPVGLRLIDPNNEIGAVLYGGISGIQYVTNGVGSSSIIVNAGTQLACCTMLPAVNASCFQGGNGGLGTPAPNSLLTADPATRGADALGLGHREPQGSGSEKGGASNLTVTLSGPPGVLPGTALLYSIVVSNTGATGLSGVRVRDWFPKNTSGLVVAFANGSWNCTPTAGANCGASIGSGNIVLSNVSLSAGSSVVISVSRTLGSFAPLGSPYSLSAVAFAPPGANELALSDNQAVLSGFAAAQDPVFASDFE